jgi:hypothetical protein
MESESACTDCFVSAQPESSDQVKMKITNACASTFLHLDLLHTQVKLDPRSLIPVGDDFCHCLLSIARRRRNG